MEQATKKKLLIGGALLVVAGVGGYFLYKFFKDKADKKREEEQKEKDQSQPTTSPTPTTTPSSGGAFGPFKNSTEVKAFQDWMDKNYPNWVNGKNLNKGSGYGTYGPSTTKAWNTYGKIYQDSLALSNKVFANTADLLASNINGANGKDIYATVDNPIFNMDNKPAGTIKGGSRMGKVISAKKGTSGFAVTFQATNGVNYWTTSSGTKIDVTPTSSFEGMTVSYLGSTI
jgi:hypothetical protein